MNVAKASCYEVKSQLYLALDIDYLDKKMFEDIYAVCEDISKTIHGLIKYLEQKN